MVINLFEILLTFVVLLKNAFLSLSGNQPLKFFNLKLYKFSFFSRFSCFVNRIFPSKLSSSIFKVIPSYPRVINSDSFSIMFHYLLFYEINKRLVIYKGTSNMIGLIVPLFYYLFS